MNLLWDFYQQRQISAASSKSDQAMNAVDRVESRISGLESAIDQLKLVNVALAELLVQKLGVPESEIVTKLKEVDLRDGVQDGRISAGATLCPKCRRRYNSKMGKCQYCGHIDHESQNILHKI